MEIIIYSITISQLCVIYCIYKLFEKYNNIFKTFNNEKKVLDRHYSKSDNEITSLIDNFNEILKKYNFELIEHINTSNKLSNELSDKIVIMNKISRQLNHSVNIINSSNFYLLKKNSAPQILKELISDIINENNKKEIKENEDENDEYEEVKVRIIKVDGKKFYVDDNNILYDIDSHNELGKIEDLQIKGKSTKIF